MVGSMYSAIAGLKAHMNRMNVIGNNIANVNTYGYKSQRAIFKDAMYSMYSRGSDGTEESGGKNPSQIGYGSQVSSIDLNMSTGTYTLGRTTDCMIYGDGFFVVGGKDGAGLINPLNPDSMRNLNMTRVGDFEFKADGYLCDGSGNTVYGFLTTSVDPVTGKPTVSDQLVPIRLPKATTVYKKPDGAISSKEEYDKADDKDKWDISTVIHYPTASVTHYKNPKGDPDTEEKYLAATEEERKQWTVEVENLPLTDYSEGDKEIPFAQLDSISINAKTGAITGTSKDTHELVTIGFLAIGNVTNANGLTHTNGSYYSPEDGAGDVQISLLGGAAKELGISNVNGSLFERAKQDAIDKGQTIPADMLQSDKMSIGSAGGANLMTGGLEGSNVDLASEISDMITTQRGYQANTRIITVTDSMLEELVNIKR